MLWVIFGLQLPKKNQLVSQLLKALATRVTEYNPRDRRSESKFQRVFEKSDPCYKKQNLQKEKSDFECAKTYEEFFRNSWS